MIAIALTGWALSGGAVLGLFAAELWTRLWNAARSRRPPGGRIPVPNPTALSPTVPGPTARGLSTLAARPPRRDAGWTIGELVCLRCDRLVDYDVRLGLFCRGCDPAEISLLLDRSGPDAAVFERLRSGIPGPT